MSSRFLRRLCVSIDIEKYSAHTNPEQSDAQRRLVNVIDYACQRARVMRVRRQQQGDGDLLVFPPGIDEARVVPALILGIRQAVYETNRDGGPFGRIRLRAALTQGTLANGANGYVGKAVVAVSRIVDSAQLRRELDGHPDTDLVLAVSGDLFDDVVTVQDHPGLSAEEFRSLDVKMPGKGFAARAWVYVAPGGPAPDPRAAPVSWRQLVGGGAAVATGALGALARSAAGKRVDGRALGRAGAAAAPGLGAVTVGSILGAGHDGDGTVAPGHAEPAADNTDPGSVEVHAVHVSVTEVSLGAHVAGDEAGHDGVAGDDPRVAGYHDDVASPGLEGFLDPHHGDGSADVPGNVPGDLVDGGVRFLGDGDGFGDGGHVDTGDGC